MPLQQLTDQDKGVLDQFANHPVQSWEWGEFRTKAGNKVVRLGFFENNKVTSALQMTIHPIPYTPHGVGVIFKGSRPAKKLLAELKKFGQRQNLIFIKLEPNQTKGKGYQATESTLKTAGALPAKPIFTPTTFWIDLTKTEEELLANMHQKTRYNIRLAERKGVKVEEDNSKKAFERYLELTEETTKRQGFYAHTERYHKLMWKTLHQKMVENGQSPVARLLTGKYKGEILTTWILFVWKNFLYYPYGASSDKHRNVMASYAQMWGAIKLGKKLGLKTFDLWGREEGEGFTKFKEGFSPEVVEFIGSWDLVINPILYRLYQLADTARWSILKTRAKIPIKSAQPKFR